MHMTHIIIDDFFRNPMAVRNKALELTYPPRPEKALYPGRNADATMQFEGIEQMVGGIVHEPLEVAAGTSHGSPRIALAGDAGMVSVHVDLCHWSCIVYLTLDKHCQGGTHFYRHKATGLDMAPVFPGMAEAAGFRDSKTALDEILEQSQNRKEDWDEIMTIPMRFNRMVIFRGYMWHDAGAAFGDRPENGRLILPFFFHNTQVG